MRAPAVLRGGQQPAMQVTMPGGLAVLARADWPAGQQAEPPAIAGFIISSFSPLAAAVADLCLQSYFGARPADRARGERTAIVLVSSSGDLATATAIASAVDQGRRVPPLLFFQSNPNAVAGYIAARWGLAGPVLCTNPAGDALADAIGSVMLLIEDGDATAALIVLADTSTDGGASGAALLIGPAAWAPAHSPSAIAALQPADHWPLTSPAETRAPQPVVPSAASRGTS
jgi:3-oxoacyl-(acyl-carrier-protein) synthase